MRQWELCQCKPTIKKELVVGRFKEDLQVMGWVELSRPQVPKR
nr:MAG TPA: hypothetical protein [Caudoviricetes sp.]